MKPSAFTMPSSPFGSGKKPAPEASTADQHLIRSHTGRLMADESFQWFVKTYLQPEHDRHLMDSIDTKRSPQDRDTSCHIREVFEALIKWPSEAYAAANQVIIAEEERQKT